MSANSAASSGQDTHLFGCVLGLGCERGAPGAEIVALAEQVLFEAPENFAGLVAIATIDSRADEPGIRYAASHFGVPLQVFDAARLELETPRIATPSDAVFRHVGCHGVAESAAMAAAGSAARLLVSKRKSEHATAALARDCMWGAA